MTDSKDGVTRRDLLKGAATATAAGLAGRVASGAEGRRQQEGRPMAKGRAKKDTDRPNLLFVFADQLGYTRCGYAGDGKARTPNIDRFASRGVNFRNAVSNMPVCCAYRATLMTGKYATSTGMVINELRLQPTHECFGHVLTRGGYQTGYVGKWHLYANELGNHYDPKNSYTPPGPYRLGFDGYWASYGFHHRYHDAYYHTNSPEKISYGEGAYEPDAQTDLTISFLRKAARSDRPFAAFLSYGTPHDPWGRNNVPPKSYGALQGVELPNPPNYKPTNDRYADGWGRLNPRQRKQLPAWRRVYYAMTANLDWNFGRLLAALDEAGLSENTLVIFTSDHGEMFGAQGRRAKNIFYEEAARIPFLVRWPKKLPAGSVSDACISSVDFMPTILSLMDLPVPRAVEGMDLSHCAMGRKGAEPDAAFLQNTGACAAWENGHEWRALRDKRYTYATYRVDRSELLFDNVADPYQRKNLAAEGPHKGTMERFRKMLAAKMESLNDTFEQCTWYRDHWTKDRIILRTARG
jgi:arylsulfatase A-like enzyme